MNIWKWLSEATGVDLTAFSKLVNNRVDKLQDPPARFGDRKVFIFPLWQEMTKVGPTKGMSLEEFKTQLLAAHKKGLVVLTRADLMQAMDPEITRKSHIDDSGFADYHFVVDQMMDEAFDDDDDLGSLVQKAKSTYGSRHSEPDMVTRYTDYKAGKRGTKQEPKPSQPSQMYKIGSGDPDDSVEDAARDAGLKLSKVPDSGSPQQNHERLMDLLRMSRFADMVLGITDRSEMKELIMTMSMYFDMTYPLSPGQVQKFVSRLLLANTEEQANHVLADLAAEMRKLSKPGVKKSGDDL